MQSQVVYTEVLTGFPNLKRILFNKWGAVSLHTWTGGRSGTIIRMAGGEQSEPPGCPRIIVPEPPLSMCVVDLTFCTEATKEKNHRKQELTAEEVAKESRGPALGKEAKQY